MCGGGGGRGARRVGVRASQRWCTASVLVKGAGALMGTGRRVGGQQQKHQQSWQRPRSSQVPLLPAWKTHPCHVFVTPLPDKEEHCQSLASPPEPNTLLVCFVTRRPWPPGIKAIKLMAWEEPYLARITALRDTELAAIKRRWVISLGVCVWGGGRARREVGFWAGWWKEEGHK